MIGSFVYFAANSEAIKIGFSTQAFIRQGQLHPRTRGLWMIGVTHGDLDSESELHDKFRHLWIPLYGEREWFRVAPELVQFIDDLEAAGDLTRWSDYTRRWRRHYRLTPPVRTNLKSKQLLREDFPQC